MSYYTSHQATFFIFFFFFFFFFFFLLDHPKTISLRIARDVVASSIVRFSQEEHLDERQANRIQESPAYDKRPKSKGKFLSKTYSRFIPDESEYGQGNRTSRQFPGGIDRRISTRGYLIARLTCNTARAIRNSVKGASESRAARRS